MSMVNKTDLSRNQWMLKGKLTKNSYELYKRKYMSKNELLETIYVKEIVVDMIFMIKRV